ncbi:hypothetical protein [Pontibacter roseus]|uniref:hypothetical protein n=1 Tax=Pontibacter roseus TaxID=336989 RepID=UPI00037207B8|nr:hypothetical protein [Pontibacter roseus]
MNQVASHLERLRPGAASNLIEFAGYDRDVSAKQLKLLKHGIWSYFLLLIFEGALRKWVLPELSTPLLIVRDPLALWLVLSAWHRGLLPANVYLSSIVVIGIIGFYTAGFFGHGNIFVALFGARIYLIHIPLIFVIGRLFDKDDVEKLGVAVLYLTIPMSVLIAMQFYSPQSAWVNLGVGGDAGGAGFGGAMGYFRPPATFSFTNGTSLYFSFAACFVFYFWINPNNVSRLLLIGATAALLVSIPLSISRGLMFQVAATLFFTLIAISKKSEHLLRMVMACVVGAFAVVLLSNLSFFNTATEAFTARYVDANKMEGGLEGVLMDRFLGGMISALTTSSELPFWGFGIGMGTNVGSMLLTGKTEFLIAEGEWGRIIGEQGPLLGITVILLRLALILKIGLACYEKLNEGNILPWVLLSFGLFNIMQGQWAQPTSLGFSVLIGGLMIASMRKGS